MTYKCEYKDAFIVPVFTQESGYWEKIMKPRLQQQGWYIAEVDCAGAEDIEDCGTRLLRELNFKVPEHGYINAMGVKDNITDIYGINMRKGLFVFYKNFEDIFSTHPDLYNGYGAEFMLQLIEDIVYYYSTLRGYIYEEYPVVVGYGVGLPTSYLPQFEELMGAENVMVAGEGTRYPWSDFEEEQRRNFPNGAPDPLYDKTGQLFGGVINHDPQATGIYVADPRYYPESPFYDPVLASKVHLVHSEFTEPDPSI